MFFLIILIQSVPCSFCKPAKLALATSNSFDFHSFFPFTRGVYFVLIGTIYPLTRRILITIFDVIMDNDIRAAKLAVKPLCVCVCGLWFEEGCLAPLSIFICKEYNYQHIDSYCSTNSRSNISDKRTFFFHVSESLGLIPRMVVGAESRLIAVLSLVSRMDFLSYFCT